MYILDFCSQKCFFQHDIFIKFWGWLWQSRSLPSYLNSILIYIMLMPLLIMCYYCYFYLFLLVVEFHCLSTISFGSFRGNYEVTFLEKLKEFFFIFANNICLMFWSNLYLFTRLCLLTKCAKIYVFAPLCNTKQILTNMHFPLFLKSNFLSLVQKSFNCLTKSWCRRPWE